MVSNWAPRGSVMSLAGARVNGGVSRVAVLVAVLTRGTRFRS